MDETLDTRHTTMSEIFIGCCEMETGSWACGSAGTLVGTHVRPYADDDHTEYRYVCLDCAATYKAE